MVNNDSELRERIAGLVPAFKSARFGYNYGLLIWIYYGLLKLLVHNSVSIAASRFLFLFPAYQCS